MTADQQRNADIRRLAEAQATEPGALLPILHAIQDELGYVPEAAVGDRRRGAEPVARRGARRRHVLPLLPDRPGRAHTVHVCRAEACQSMGARALEAHARKTLGVDFHETTADGRFTLEPVYCLGNCACSPAVMVDETVYGRVTPQRFDELVELSHGRRHDGLRPVGYHGALARRRRGRRGDRGRGHARGTPGGPRAQRLARPVLARAAGRGRGRRRVALRPGRHGRRAGPVRCGLPRGRRARARLGPTEEIPYLAKQKRLTFARVGIIDPAVARRLRAHGGYRGLRTRWR